MQPLDIEKIESLFSRCVDLKKLQEAKEHAVEEFKANFPAPRQIFRGTLGEYNQFVEKCNAHESAVEALSVGLKELKEELNEELSELAGLLPDEVTFYFAHHAFIRVWGCNRWYVKINEQEAEEAKATPKLVDDKDIPF